MEKLHVIENSWARIEIKAKHWSANFFIEQLSEFLESCAKGHYDQSIIRLNLGMHRVGDRIYRVRNMRGFYQAELARASGVPQSEISRYERNQKLPGVVSAKKLALALNCDYKLFL